MIPLPFPNWRRGGADTSANSFHYLYRAESGEVRGRNGGSYTVLGGLAFYGDLDGVLTPVRGREMTWLNRVTTVPARARHVVHLPRHWDVFAPSDRQQLLDMALELAGRARGLVLHDREDWFSRRAELAGRGLGKRSLGRCHDGLFRRWWLSEKRDLQVSLGVVRTD
jgi:hypothetical protein